MKSIRKSIGFEARRIKYCVRNIENQNFIRELTAKKIPIKVCPVSNLQTHAVKKSYSNDVKVNR